ncbi:MAG: hypothetical protein GX552_03640 [Chloroflexi bacterium]|jgi:hypothetical protein|nr:hypothetical protein [Chloroflexota bacterium]
MKKRGIEREALSMRACFNLQGAKQRRIPSQDYGSTATHATVDVLLLTSPL